MANSDYNAIKPVESLQNIGRLSAAERRRERKRRQDTQKDKEEQREETEETAEETMNETADQHDPGDSGYSIDYCA